MYKKKPCLVSAANTHPTRLIGREPVLIPNYSKQINGIITGSPCQKYFFLENRRDSQKKA